MGRKLCHAHLQRRRGSVFFARFLDRLPYGRQVPRDLLVGESDYPIAHLVQPRSAGGIVLLLAGLGVRVPIDFDAQPGLGAGEVGNEPAEERLLTANVDAQLGVTHGVPDALFGGGRLVAGFARLAEEGGGRRSAGACLAEVESLLGLIAERIRL